MEMLTALRRWLIYDSFKVYLGVSFDLSSWPCLLEKELLANVDLLQLPTTGGH